MIEKRFFNCFQLQKVKRKGFHENQVVLMVPILARRFELRCYQSKCWRQLFPLVTINNWWKIHVDIISLAKCMSNSNLPSFCMEIIGNFEMPDREIWSTSKMINGINMKFSKNLSNRNISKVSKFDVQNGKWHKYEIFRKPFK